MEAAFLVLKTMRKRRKRAVFDDVLEKYIACDDRGLAPLLPLKHGGASVGRRLNPMRLAEVRKCPDCRLKPVVFLTKRKIPVCQRHWDKLAGAQIGWSEEG